MKALLRDDVERLKKLQDGLVCLGRHYSGLHNSRIEVFLRWVLSSRVTRLDNIKAWKFYFFSHPRTKEVYSGQRYLETLAASHKLAMSLMILPAEQRHMWGIAKHGMWECALSCNAKKLITVYALDHLACDQRWLHLNFKASNFNKKLCIDDIHLS